MATKATNRTTPTAPSKYIKFMLNKDKPLCTTPSVRQHDHTPTLKPCTHTSIRCKVSVSYVLDESLLGWRGVKGQSKVGEVGRGAGDCAGAVSSGGGVDCNALSHPLLRILVVVAARGIQVSSHSETTDAHACGLHTDVHTTHTLCTHLGKGIVSSTGSCRPMCSVSSLVASPAATCSSWKLVMRVMAS